MDEYTFHSKITDGYLVLKINADSKDEVLRLAKSEFEEWKQERIWHSNMPVYLGEFSYDYHGEDVDPTLTRGEVIDFSSIQ